MHYVVERVVWHMWSSVWCGICGRACGVPYVVERVVWNVWYIICCMFMVCDVQYVKGCGLEYLQRYHPKRVVEVD